MIERYGVWFVVRDLGSSNGTFGDNERLVGEQRLRPGDEKVTEEASVGPGEPTAALVSPVRIVTGRPLARTG